MKINGRFKKSQMSTLQSSCLYIFRLNRSFLNGVFPKRSGRFSCYVRYLSKYIIPFAGYVKACTSRHGFPIFILVCQCLQRREPENRYGSAPRCLKTLVAACKAAYAAVFHKILHVQRIWFDFSISFFYVTFLLVFWQTIWCNI